MISLRRRPRFMEVRLHHMFLEADLATRDALSDYLFRSDRSADLGAMNVAALHFGRQVLPKTEERLVLAHWGATP